MIEVDLYVGSLCSLHYLELLKIELCVANKIQYN